MNLRNVSKYTVGLDLGTGSVGWAVTDTDTGDILHFKGRPTWGSRLFPSADTAAVTRQKRAQRRRYARRRQRIEKLQELFIPEIEKVDREFFVRLNQSRLLKDERNPTFDTEYSHPFFNNEDFKESDYYKEFPTIWHLRKNLMESDKKADIRLVYLALHNIVKYRGNFLQENNKDLRAANANAGAAAIDLSNALEEYFSLHEDESALTCVPNVADLQMTLEQPGLRNGERLDRIVAALNMPDRARAKLFAKACIGQKVEFSKLALGMEKQEGTNAYIWDDDKYDELVALCPEDFFPVLETLKNAYSAYVLSDLLAGKLSISASLIDSYEQHQNDLKIVKELVREYLGQKEYGRLFRGPKFANGDYNFNKVAKPSYTSYILGESLCNKQGTTREELVKELKRVFDDCSAIQADKRYQKIKQRLEDDPKFLIKQKTRANGAIPYQLHLEEMHQIIEKQGKYYPFLVEQQDLIEKLVSSRIPYYVGPLNGGHDPNHPYPTNPIDPKRKFAWSVRKPGMEHEKAYPWNVDEVIDSEETAERFIRRMTGTCTYLYGEPVVPRCSLLYEEFCVLNELNGARWGEGNGDTHRFDSSDRTEILEQLFKKRKRVTHKAIATWLEINHGVTNVKISGTQAENAFESKLSSYNDFCNLLGVDGLEDVCPLTKDDIEQIILWVTVFEDKKLLLQKLQRAFGDKLSEKQIASIMRKPYAGWGRLSSKLLTGIKRETPFGRISILDVMRDGDPRPGHHLDAMNFMEILREKDFGFQDRIDEINKERTKESGLLLSVEDLPGSPALRRSVNQAMHILKEIVSIVGKEPSRIVIEVTRDPDEEKRGHRTDTRYKQLSEALAAIKTDIVQFDSSLLAELKERKDSLDSERLMLYFQQCGKSLYSGKPLDINRLSEYQVDHIIPQCYIKDDSLDNKALVFASENQIKLDSLLLDKSIIRSQKGRWQELHRAGLISNKKFRNLTCTEISDRMMKGFINRQLVETSQIVKFVRQMCEQRYESSEVISLRASLSHNLRDRCGFIKCRELNDYHHAHDAYLACQIARFIGIRYPRWQDGISREFINKYIKQLVKKGKSSGKFFAGKSGFIIDSFMHDGFDRETGEIFRDGWDATFEITRMRRVLGYKDCFITRMPEEQTGAYWEETIYSPLDAKNGKNLQIPLKQSGKEGYLDPKKYGGTNTAFNAYFFAFVAKDARGRDKYFFEGVPVYLAKQLNEQPRILVDFANSIAATKKYSTAKILRSKVPLRQKFLLDGTSFYLGGRTGNKNVILSGVEFACGIDMAKMIDTAIKHPEELSQKELISIIQMLADTIERNSDRQASLINFRRFDDKLRNIDAIAASRIIKNLLNSMNGVKQSCDLSDLGGSKQSGFMQSNIATLFERITWCYSSITGMFEQRVSFEDLKNGI